MTETIVVGFEVLRAVVMKSTIVWDITPYSPLSQPTFRRNKSPSSSGSKAELCLPPAFTLVSGLAYFSTLKMKAICSLKTSVDSQRTTHSYIPEDGTLQKQFLFSDSPIVRISTCSDLSAHSLIIIMILLYRRY
jgi:hypothetical protein